MTSRITQQSGLGSADLVNTVLSDYGNATGASFDLTEMSNLAGMGGMQTDNSDNMTMMMMTDESIECLTIVVAII